MIFRIVYFVLFLSISGSAQDLFLALMQGSFLEELSGSYIEMEIEFKTAVSEASTLACCSISLALNVSLKGLAFNRKQ